MEQKKLIEPNLEIDFRIEGGYLYAGIYDQQPKLLDWIDNEKNVSKKARKVIERLEVPAAVLYNIDVEYEYRGQGVGKKLMHMFLEEVREAKNILLVADIYEMQNYGFDIIKWYNKLGFKIIGKTGTMPIMLLEKS